MPKKQKKRPRISISTAVRQYPLYPNHVWSWDFLFGRTEDGRALTILNIVDEFSRFNIALQVKRHFTGKDVAKALGQAMFHFGIPGCIRSDNGSEFIAKHIKQWLNENGVGIMYIEPGSPWQNPYVESLNSRLRDECLNSELFTSLAETRYVLEQWRREYNTERPHGGLGRRTPAAVYDSIIQGDSLRKSPWIMAQPNMQTVREYYQ